jgi:hypothetical protein
LALACHSLFFLPYGLWRIEMNDDDLRDCFAMFAMAGWIMNGDYSKDEIPTISYEMADKMLDARKKEKEQEDSGIAAVVPKKPRKR